MRSWPAWFGVELNVVSYKEKFVSGLGGFLAILALIVISERTLFTSAYPLIASMGASAVLVFAVPHGQLSQPWPVIAGHVFSALIGVTCAKFIPYPGVAMAASVSLSIGAMHQFKCIHPPGGATALSAVMGGPAVHALGFKFVLAPVLFNAVAIIAIAVAFNAFFSWRRYPALFNHPATTSKSTGTSGAPLPASHDDVVEALRSLDSFVDITEADLIRLSQILRLPREPKDLKRNAFTAG
ncbi:MAG: hypothetical protein JWL90_1403 [Chthoniobacteraceae bacterium]|nr:hypothetical protein [Chthoniobacteraceae bacterium]MDB6175185.1 hypothetical protein [Chthoniobacteraceae bacterium]